MVWKLRWPCVLATAALACVSSVASAQSLQSARQAWLNADFQRAQQELYRILESPNLSLEEALQAHRYLAALMLMVDRRAQAKEHAVAAVALTPAAAPPEGAPTDALHLFDEARQATEGKQIKLRLDFEQQPSNQDKVLVSGTLNPAPRALVGELHIECAEGPKPRGESRGFPPSVSLRVPLPRRTVRCRVEARAPSGAALLALRETWAAPSGKLPVPQAVRTFSSSSLSEHETDTEGVPAWGWWAAGSTVLIATAVTVAVIVLGGSAGDAVLQNPTVEGW